MSPIAKLLALFAENADLIELLLDAIARGGSKTALEKAIRGAMIDASDAAMREELGEGERP